MKTLKIKESTHYWLRWIQVHMHDVIELKTMDETIEYLFNYWNEHYKGINKDDK